jgi:hypothetical protein
MLDLEDLALVVPPDLLQVNVLDLVLLLETQFLEKLTLTLKLVYRVLVFLYLLLVLPDVLLNPRGHPARRWAPHLLLAGCPLGRLVVETTVGYVALVVVLCLDAVCVHLLMGYLIRSNVMFIANIV